MSRIGVSARIAGVLALLFVLAGCARKGDVYGETDLFAHREGSRITDAGENYEVGCPEGWEYRIDSGFLFPVLLRPTTPIEEGTHDELRQPPILATLEAHDGGSSGRFSEDALERPEVLLREYGEQVDYEITTPVRVGRLNGQPAATAEFEESDGEYLGRITVVFGSLDEIDLQLVFVVSGWLAVREELRAVLDGFRPLTTEIRDSPNYQTPPPWRSCPREVSEDGRDGA